MSLLIILYGRLKINTESGFLCAVILHFLRVLSMDDNDLYTNIRSHIIIIIIISHILRSKYLIIITIIIRFFLGCLLQNSFECSRHFPDFFQNLRKDRGRVGWILKNGTFEIACLLQTQYYKTVADKIKSNSKSKSKSNYNTYTTYSK